MSQTPATVAAPPQAPGADTSVREVQYEFTLNLPSIFSQVGASLLVSTYQAGKLVVVGVADGQLALSFHNFERLMGVAVRADCIAVGASSQVYFLRAAPDLSPRIAPAGRYDGCFLTRSAQFTGNIHVHELAWAFSGVRGQEKRVRDQAAGDQPTPDSWLLASGELWVVNTLFSCLCTLDDKYSFVPRWRPPFISALAAEERCHLNGLAIVEGRPRYATALSETDTREGWRPLKATGGCLIDVPKGAIVARGLAMPHSPRVLQGRVWLLDSGTGRVVTVEPASGKVTMVSELPGFTRGLAFAGPYAFVGLSKIRETSAFGGVPIAAQREKLKCGVGVVDVATGRYVGHLEFKSGVEEIFDVQVLPGVRFPFVSGPFTAAEGSEPIWTVPDPRPGAATSPSA